jgi:hypothetical protein
MLSNAREEQEESGIYVEVQRFTERAGTCYHLYTSTRFSGFEDQETPEISRVPLQQLCLQIKLLNLGKIASFLGKVCFPMEM